MASMAIEINDKMPLHVLDLIKNEVELNGQKIAMLGISYREDVGDTRFSPTETLYKELKNYQVETFVHDPYLQKWDEEEGAPFLSSLGSLSEFDIVILCTRHKEYLQISDTEIQQYARKGALWVDAFNILTDDKIRHLLQNS